ncbi:MAG: enoyl-CoA hydratase [Anaerolineales bacterium]|nr:enoyl-CoA hydratase [Anaerolineales bacterium]
MTFTMIEVEQLGRVGLIRLNRPKALNALNNTLMKELVDALGGFDDNPSIGAMVVTGNEKVFAAGADIKEMAEASSIDMLLSDNISIWDRIGEIKKPIIAAVSGWALGGGNELAMACDMIVASESAKFGQPEINLGVFPGAGGTQRLTKAVGKVIAMEMILNNRTLSADEAYQFGLVNHVVPVEGYLDDAVKLAQEIAERAPLAIRLAKEAVNHAFESFLSDGIADERRAFYFLFSSQDQKEGMAAFIEKRDPEWKGE